VISEEHCIYVKRTTRRIMFLILYIDDILLTGNNLEIINATKQWLSSVFEKEDMGEVKYVLGVKIVRNRHEKLLGTCKRHISKEFWNAFECTIPNPLTLLLRRV